MNEMAAPPTIEPAAFAAGMFAIAAAYWRDLSEHQIEVFYRKLGWRMSTDEWKQVVDSVLDARTVESQPPTPGHLLAILDVLRAGPTVDGPTREELDAADAAGDRETRR